LGIGARVTPALAEEATLGALDSTFEGAAEIFQRRGVALSPKRIRAISQSLAAAALRRRRQCVQSYLAGATAAGQALKGKNIVVCMDGGRMNIRTPKRRGPMKKDAKVRGFHADWREPKLFTIYTIGSDGKLSPEAPAWCDGTLDGHQHMLDLLACQLHALGAAQAAKVIFMGDGARWIWDHLDELLERVGIDREKVSEVLDFAHAVEHLAKVAEVLPGSTAASRRRWLNKHRHMLRHGEVEQVVKDLARLSAKHRSKTIQREREYFVKHTHRMQYEEYEKAGIPMGSGSVESAIRRIVNLRLKGAGMFWLKHNGEGFLHLRCQAKAGQWQGFFKDLLTFLPDDLS